MGSSKKANQTDKPSESTDGDGKGNKPDDLQSTRETVESIVVAFILAFLFRAFVAEAFVIPTGSMAPTLMGAHKDLFCAQCGQQYQANASSEYDSSTGALQRNKTIASNCSNCRAINAYDFENNSNHRTFSGDRILVSKFDYVLSRPERWDVLVFKFPLEARMNYIKRLVGLPGETLRLQHGDVFIVDSESGKTEIARKPPHKIQAMKQLVQDSDHSPSELIKQGWPSSWQPLPNAAEGWDVQQTESNWNAKLQAGSSASWLRYYHKFASNDEWEQIRNGETIEVADPYASRLITDYLAYNTQYTMYDALELFNLNETGLKSWLPGFLHGLLPNPRFVPDEDKTSGKLVFDAAMEMPTVGVRANSELNDGMHWVGDLIAEFDVEVQSDSGELLLDLVEFGIHFQCVIDVASGKATIQALDNGNPIPVFDSESTLTFQTSVRGQGRYSLQFANVDDSLVLWVNGRVQTKPNSGHYRLDSHREEQNRRPYWSKEDPLDAAPIGIGGRNLAMNVEAARVYRDIYYVTVQPGNNFSDYPLAIGARSVVPDANERQTLRGRSTQELVAAVYAHPEWWSETALFGLRESKQYILKEDEYFPMGDNSAASSDARAWYGHHFVEKQFLLGKALLVFWPHTWNTPVPFTPNFKRMGLIR